MSEFFTYLFHPEISYLRTALLLSFPSAFLLAFLGSFVVARRMTYTVGAISHANFLGIGLSLHLPVLSFELSTLCTSLLSATIIWFMTHKRLRSERIGVVLTLIWTIGVAGGVLLISSYGGYVDPVSLLTGSLLLTTSFDLISVSVLSLVVGLLLLIGLPRFRALAFDKDFLFTRGIRVDVFQFFFFIFLALSIFVLISEVGVILVLSLITLPAAAAFRLSKHFHRAILLSFCIILLSFIMGIVVGFIFDLIPSAVIVFGVSLFYVISFPVSHMLRR